MILILFFMLGCVVGVIVRHFIIRFPLNLAREVQFAYHSIFTQQTVVFNPAQLHFTSIKPAKCGQILWYLCGFGGFFVLAGSLLPPLAALWFGLYFSLLFKIALLDWYYQLISPNSCLALLVLGFGKIYWFEIQLPYFEQLAEFIQFDLYQGINSAAIAFLLFFTLYYVAKIYYQREALGRGDYWLMLGLGSVIHYQDLPLLIFLASFTALVFALWHHFFVHQDKQSTKQIKYLPFAPFLTVATLGIVLWRLYSLG